MQATNSGDVGTSRVAVESQMSATRQMTSGDQTASQVVQQLRIGATAETSRCDGSKRANEQVTMPSM